MCDHRIAINDMARASLNIQKITKDLKIYNKSHKTNEQKQKAKRTRKLKLFQQNEKEIEKKLKRKTYCTSCRQRYQCAIVRIK